MRADWMKSAMTGIAIAQTIALPAAGATSKIGRTWPIVEPDALAELEARASRLGPNLASRFGPRTNWRAMQAATLPPATRSATRTVVPFHQLEFDLKLPDGRLLYPKGFRFNPLEYVSLPQRLIITHPRNLGWAVVAARPADFILLTAGDAVNLSEKWQRPLFLLEERVKDRLGLSAAPVIVSQAGGALRIEEMGPERLKVAPEDRP